MNIPSRLLRYLLFADRTFFILSPPEPQPFYFSRQSSLHFLTQPVFKVGFLLAVKWVGFAPDFDVPMDFRFERFAELGSARVRP